MAGVPLPVLGLQPRAKSRAEHCMDLLQLSSCYLPVILPLDHLRTGYQSWYQDTVLNRELFDSGS